MLGKKVREFRKSRHLTLAKLADRLGISESYLSQLESGRIDPSISLVRKLAAEFQVPIAAFFDAEYEEPLVTKLCDRVVTSSEDGSVVISRLTPSAPNLLLCMSEFQICPASSHVLDAQPFHSCLYLTEGSLSVAFSDTRAELSEGDSIYLPVDLCTELRNHTDKLCRGVICTRQMKEGQL